MLFSVLIANYNNSRFLSQALQSVLAQTWYDWEVIVVDDGSGDGVCEIVAPYLRDPRIYFYENPQNFGCGYTKKRCIDLARGEIVGFLDADDALHPEALRTMIQAHDGLPDYSIVHSTHFVCDQALRVSRIADYTRSIPRDTEYLFLNDGRVHHFATFKRSLYQKTPGISPRLQKAVDQDLYYKMEETGPIQFIDLPLYYYRIHHHSISTQGNEKDASAWHYQVIEAACLRRMKNLTAADKTRFKKKRLYRAKMIKTRIISAFRRKDWMAFGYHLLLYPFSGGMRNLVQYVVKWRTQGKSLLRRSFYFDHQIQA